MGLLVYFIAGVWFINGFFCKLLNLVPRHEQIVGRILGEANADLLTRAIGVLEILMTIWILSGIRARLCFSTQILLVAAMNLIEFFLAPDLLLFGRLNIMIAMAFVALLGWYVVRLQRRQSAARFTG